MLTRPYCHHQPPSILSVSEQLARSRLLAAPAQHWTAGGKPQRLRSQSRHWPGCWIRPLIPAAVLVAICARAEPTVLLTERTAHLSAHAGQIAFPGGKIDAGRRDAAAAALREASRGNRPRPGARRAARLSRTLPDRHRLPDHAAWSRWCTPLLRPAPDPAEVAGVFEVPLAF